MSIQGGFTAVYVASQNGHTDVVDLLVKAGADIHLANTNVSLQITVFKHLYPICVRSLLLHPMFLYNRLAVFL